jgi:hypothetical protein
MNRYWTSYARPRLKKPFKDSGRGCHCRNTYTPVWIFHLIFQIPLDQKRFNRRVSEDAEKNIFPVQRQPYISMLVA